MLTQVKMLLGIQDTEKDSLLNYLIDSCCDEATAFCNLPEFDDRLEPVVVKMVVFNYNRLGSEGVATQSFSGVSESFTEGYPLEVLNHLRKFRKVVFI
jgi:hypothetical protein